MRLSSVLLLSLPLAAAEYRAGIARVDITPPIGHEMGGYAARKHGATGIHDPLYATVLVIESGGNSIALITCDLRSFVSTRLGKNTVVSVSHTHSGPHTHACARANPADATTSPRADAAASSSHTRAAARSHSSWTRTGAAAYGKRVAPEAQYGNERKACRAAPRSSHRLHARHVRFS